MDGLQISFETETILFFPNLFTCSCLLSCFKTNFINCCCSLLVVVTQQCLIDADEYYTMHYLLLLYSLLSLDSHISNTPEIIFVFVLMSWLNFYNRQMSSNPSQQENSFALNFFFYFCEESFGFSKQNFVLILASLILNPFDWFKFWCRIRPLSI